MEEPALTQAIAKLNLKAKFKHYTFERFIRDVGCEWEWDFSFSDGIFKNLENKFTIRLYHDGQPSQVTRIGFRQLFRFNASIKYKIKQSQWNANSGWYYDSIIVNSAVISFVNERISHSHLLQFNPESSRREGTDTNFVETNDFLQDESRDVSLIWDMNYSGIIITINVTNIRDESVDIMLPNENNLTFPNGILIPSSTTAAIIPANPRTNFAKYFLAEKLSDCKVVAGDKIFPAHRFVLIEMSPFLEKMLSTNTAENQNKEWKIGDFDAVVVEDFLMFGYTGACKSFTLTNKNTATDILKQLYRMGRKYEVEPLVNQCNILLKGLVNNENAISIYHFGFLYGSKTLMDAAKNHFTRFKSQILHNSEAYQHLHNNYPVEMVFQLTK